LQRKIQGQESRGTQFLGELLPSPRKNASTRAYHQYVAFVNKLLKLNE